MANPNLFATSALYGKTAGMAVTTSTTAIVTNSASSGKVYKVNSLIIANVDGTNSATCEVDVSTDNQSSNYALVYNLVVPPGATIAILTTPLYLDETDSIRVSANNNSDLQWFASGTELID